MYIAILGRQPLIGLAELERVFEYVAALSEHSALINTEHLDVEKLGGTLKAGRVIIDIPGGKKNDWRSVSMKIVQYYSKKWQGYDGKITLGISAYDFRGIQARDVQKTGLVLKSKIKSDKTSLRLIPNSEVALSTATSHHNKLGLSDNKVELIVTQGQDGRVIVAESTGSQNITALAARDQGRPRRDAFVGMLPPKLAQIMINLAGGNPETDRLLDPFCGTGVVLQEAALMGYAVYGTDLSEKMIRYSRDNLNWLQDSQKIAIDWYLHEGDATDTAWQQPIDIVVAETYLGQPFSAPPSPVKLKEVRGNCNHIIGSFMKNLAKQIAPGASICLAVPAWRDTNGKFTHLPLVSKPEDYGFETVNFQNVNHDELLYYREDQVVARELLVLRRK